MKLDWNDFKVIIGDSSLYIAAQKAGMQTFSRHALYLTNTYEVLSLIQPKENKDNYGHL